MNHQNRANFGQPQNPAETVSRWNFFGISCETDQVIDNHDDNYPNPFKTLAQHNICEAVLLELL